MARASTTASVANETTDCHSINTLATRVSGIVSVGENAVTLVEDRYR